MLPNIHRTTISLVDKEYLTPNYLRITFHCEDIAPYENIPLGVNNKIFIPPVGCPTVEMPLFNQETKKWEVENEENLPAVRTYTHRFIDFEKGLMTMDFAVHEGDSVACNWAVNAEKGDQIGVAMKLQHRPLVAEVDHYYFVTDMTGIPVASAIIERLPETAKVHVIAEIMEEKDQYDHFPSAAEVKVDWVYNATPEKGSQLTEHLASIIEKDALESSRFAHITAEYTTVRAIRDFLRNHQEWNRDELFACSYWQIGKRENEPREKRIEE